MKKHFTEEQILDFLKQADLQAQLVELAQERRRFGYRCLHIQQRHAGQPQADLPAVPSRRLDGEAAEAPPRGRGGARTSEPAKRTESGLVDGFRLRCAQHWAKDQMPDGGR